jgi:hypothetical protein
MTRFACCVFVGVVLSACGGSSSSDGGLDGSVDGGGDAGGLDASLPPLELTFEKVNLPAVAQRNGLVSDGTTLYAISSIGSLAQGTFQVTLAASTDEGATFQVRSLTPANQLTAAADGGVYAVVSQELRRSDDGARTFAPVTLPASLSLALPPTLTVTADDALWVTSRGTTPALVRSVDRGATFTELTVPTGTTRLEPCSTETSGYVAVRNGDEPFAADGGSLESLGAFASVAGPVACHVTATGSVLATVSTGNAYEAWRLPAGGTAWEGSASPGFFRFVGGGSRVYRWLNNGRVDESTDDGATWTTRVGAAPEGAVLEGVVRAGTTLVSLIPGGLVRLPAGASAWEVLRTPGLPIALDVVDLAFAADNAAMALLLNDNVQRTVYVAEDGMTWRRGRTLVQGAATALALHPDGTQVFLGAVDGTYRVLADAGTETFIDSRIETAAGVRDPNPIQQAVWGRAQGTFIFVTTANASDTAGSVWQLNPDNGVRDWEERRPFSTTTAAAVRPGGYYALAVAAEAPPPALTRSLFTTMRSNVSANSFLNYLFTRQPVFGSNAWWLQDAPPVGFTAARAASVNGAWGEGLAVLWPENQLWVGRLPNLLRRVPVSQGFGDLRVVRFGKDGRLWLGGSGGLWRTSTPVVLE